MRKVDLRARGKGFAMTVKAWALLGAAMIVFAWATQPVRANLEVV